MKESKEAHRWEGSLDFYKEPDDGKEWIACNECGLTPRVWLYDNGRVAHCACGNNKYKHKHSIKAKSINECVTTDGSIKGYDSDELRKNWNKYIKTINNNK